MPNSEPQAQPPQRSDHDRAIFASLRAINAAAHKWQTELTAILDTPPATPAATHAMIVEQLKRQPQIRAVVNENLATIRNIFGQDVAEREWGASVLVELDLGWKDIENHWILDPDHSDGALDVIRSVRDKLDEIIYTCLSNTLTPDINDRLPNLEVGQPLDVEFVYGDDFPRDPKLRKRLVLGVAQEQGVIEGGIFVADSSLIYRIAPTPRQRRKSLWHIAGLLVLGGLVAVAAAFAGQWVPSWPVQPAQWPKLLTNYVFLFIGAGGHLLIDAVKQKHSETKPDFAAMDNWMLWLHVRETSVLYSILWADLGFVLLTAMAQGLDWRAAFAAGYSIDSITDLFLSRFESLIGKAAAQIKPAAAA